MLTYRSGAVCHPSTAGFMADHLLERTLPEGARKLAAYYQQQSADGFDGTIPRLRPHLSPVWAEVMGIDPRRPPNRAELVHLLAGYRTDGEKLPGNRRYAKYKNRANVAYIDFTFSADKSVSLAWAFAETEAERAIIMRAHHEAVQEAMVHAENTLGWTRRRSGAVVGGDDDPAEPAGDAAAKPPPQDNGLVRIPGEIGWIEFDHYTARPTAKIAVTEPDGTPATVLQTVMVAGMPQLHTHVVIPNVVVTADGHVGAMERNFHGQVHEFGAYYQAHLAQNLRRFGAEVELDEATGAARLIAIPENVRSAFSHRTQGAEQVAREYAAQQGLEWDALFPAAKIKLLKGGAKATRQGKGDDVGDWAAWQAIADELGWKHSTVLDPDRRWLPGPDDERIWRAYQAALPILEKQFARRAVLPAAEARIAATRGLIAAGADAAGDIDAVTALMRTHGVRQGGELVGLIWGEDPAADGEIKITTALHESQERALVGLARVAAADRSGALGLAAIEEAVKAVSGRENLDFSGEHGQAQRAIIDHLGTAGRLAVAIGVAGAGKTTLLMPLIEAWKRDGRDVWGVAIAHRTSDLLSEAGVEARSTMALDSLIRRIRDGQIALTERSVVVLDEISQIGTRDGLTLLQLRAQHGFSIVGIGDPMQSQAIEAGAVIGLLERAFEGVKAPIPTLERSVRQKRPRDRETALLFRQGNAAAAIARKREDGTVLLVPGGYEDAVRRAADLWEERVRTNRSRRNYRLTISAPTNADALAVASEIRERRRKWGGLGENVTTLAAIDQAGTTFDLPISVGDRVRLFKSTWAKVTNGRGRSYNRNLGRNGTVVEIRDIRDDGLVLRNHAKNIEAFVPFDAMREGKTQRIALTYGDVLSIDAVQGQTGTEHIDFMGGGSAGVHGFKAYVAESRSRETTWLVLSDGAERQEISQRRPLNDLRPITEDDVYKNVAGNLSRQPEKANALALLDRAEDVQRGTVDAMQESFWRGERRKVRRKPTTTIRQRAMAAAQDAAAARAAGDGGSTASSPDTAHPTTTEDTEREGEGINSGIENTAQGQERRTVGPETRKAGASRLPRSAKPVRNVISETEAQAEFADELRRAGLRVEGPPVMDGHMHRVAVEGDRRGKKSGAYVGHLGGLPAGFIRNFKTGEVIRWRASGSTRALTPEELARAQAETARRQLERERERRAAEEDAAKRMRALWQHSRLASRHPYLERKGVAGHGLRMDRAGRLLVPMHDADGQIWSMQTITAAGEKLYEKGGRKQGMHALLGALAPGTPLVIAEGFATAATLREVIGLPVAVAFDSGNLMAVAEAYRARDPERPILIAGDNDHHLPRREPPFANVGKEKAEAAALAVGGTPIIPTFEASSPGTDWNDYAAQHGKEAARAALTARMAELGIRPADLPPEAYAVAVRPTTEPTRQQARRRVAEDQAPREKQRQVARERATAAERPSEGKQVSQAARDAARQQIKPPRPRPAQVNRERIAARQRSRGPHESPHLGTQS